MKIVIAYFNYNSLDSNINMFNDFDDAKKWLFKRWGFLLDNNTLILNESFDEFCLLLREQGVFIEKYIIENN